MVYTCNSCNLAFEDAANQREHMKGEWHRYNLKRRVAQLPPVDETSFNSKVASSKETVDNTQLTKKEERRRQKEAIIEQKRQILEMARRAMQQKHDNEILGQTDSKEAPVETPDEVQKPEEVLSDFDKLSVEEQEKQLYDEKVKNKVEIATTTCLFCHPKEKSDFETIDENIVHMFHKHGLYIPESKYLVDDSGLLKYLGEKIGFGNVCLCCNYQGRNVEAVREHMKIKRHMRIPYESEDEKLEISEFYDFTSTYSDYVKAEDVSANDAGWEDVSGDEGEYDSDEEIPDNKSGAIIQDGFDLILPTGKVLGHRSLQRYYRQNLAPERELSEGQGTVIAAENRHLLTVRDQKEITVQKLAWRNAYQRYDQDDRRAAKSVNYKKHYRNQLLQ